MAEQSGIIPLKGTIGKITFYKTRDGYLAREKTSTNAEKIATDPAYARTRENNAEFGVAGKAGRLLRSCLKGLTQTASDSRMTGRLTRELLKVVKTDTTNGRGKRLVTDGNLILLEGFEFNQAGKLGTSLFAPFTATINRVAGTLEVVLDPFIPVNMVSAPPGSTHFKLVSGGAAVDFNQQQYTVDTNSTAALPWDHTATATITLSNSVTPGSTHPLFLVLGIEFYQEVNGDMYPLKNGAFNPLAVVKVEV